MNVLLVDVCHTLYDANTTYGFLDRCLVTNPGYAVLMKRRGSVFERVKARLFPGQDIIRQQAVALLAGAPKQSLTEAAHDYVQTLSGITPVQDYIRGQQADGVQVYLVSSSLDLLVDAIAQQLGVAGWFASRLGFNQGVCSGKLESDLTGTKDRIIREHFADAAAIEFVSDNFSDANCIPLVQSFRPVYARQNLRARAFWSRQKVGEPIYE